MKISRTASGAIDFRGRQYSDLGMVPGAIRARKTGVVQALQIPEPFELVQEDGRVETGNAGDWILQATAADFYVVKDHVFRSIYSIIAKDESGR
jgi:hypothetical protein